MYQTKVSIKIHEALQPREYPWTNWDLIGLKPQRPTTREHKHQTWRDLPTRTKKRREPSLPRNQEVSGYAHCDQYQQEDHARSLLHESSHERDSQDESRLQRSQLATWFWPSQKQSEDSLSILREGWASFPSEGPSQSSDCTCSWCELRQVRQQSVHIRRLQQAASGIDGWPADESPHRKIEQLTSIHWSGRNVAIKAAEGQLDRFKSSKIKNWIALLHAQPKGWLCPAMELLQWGRKVREIVLHAMASHSNWNHLWFIRSSVMVEVFFSPAMVWYFVVIYRGMAQESQELTKQPTVQDTSSANI